MKGENVKEGDNDPYPPLTNLVRMRNPISSMIEADDILSMPAGGKGGGKTVGDVMNDKELIVVFVDGSIIRINANYGVYESYGDRVDFFNRWGYGAHDGKLFGKDMRQSFFVEDVTESAALKPLTVKHFPLINKVMAIKSSEEGVTLEWELDQEQDAEVGDTTPLDKEDELALEEEKTKGDAGL